MTVLRLQQYKVLMALRNYISSISIEIWKLINTSSWCSNFERAELNISISCVAQIVVNFSWLLCWNKFNSCLNIKSCSYSAARSRKWSMSKTKHRYTKLKQTKWLPYKIPSLDIKEFWQCSTSDTLATTTTWQQLYSNVIIVCWAPLSQIRTMVWSY